MRTDWSRARLDECCEIVAGATPSTSIKTYWDGDICWATPKDLSELEGAYISDTPRKITRAGLDSCAATILPVGSVLFSSRAPIGHVAINAVPMATNQGFKSFVPKPEHVDAKFLYWWLRTNCDYLESLGNGATFKEVSKAVVARIEILLPPLAEQQRIANILDKTEALRSKRRATIAQLDILCKAIFLDLFGDPATNPNGWSIRALKEVASTTSGGTPNRAIPEYFGGGIPWVKSGELHQDIVTKAEESLTQSGIAESSAKVMPVGTVLVAMYGATVGAIAILGVKAATNQAICCIEPGASIDNIFLVHLFKLLSPSLLLKRVGGAQPNLSQDFIRNLLIPLPPLDLQHKFACRIAAVEKLKNAYLSSLANMDALFASLQHLSFQGEL